MRDIMSKEEAAEQLGISVRTVQRLMRNGEIGVRRVGRLVWILRKSVDDFWKRDHITVPKI